MTGLLDIAADRYHDDQVADGPTASKSILHLLLTASPAHARANHPRLNPDYVRVEEDKFNVGTAAHALLLQGETVADVYPHDSWRSNQAKADKEFSRANGRVPLLVKQWDEVRRMCESVRRQLDRLPIDPPLLTDGQPEKTIVWDEAGVKCRARLDWLRDDLTAIDDLKTTSRSAAPEAWSRTCLSIGGDLQAALYLRGIRAVTGARPVFRFVVVETFPPYAVSVFELGPSVMALAEEKLDHALTVWRRCLASGDWPAYPSRVCTVDLPPWAEGQWFERQTREEIAA